MVLNERAQLASHPRVGVKVLGGGGEGGGRQRGENLAAGTEQRDSEQHGREQAGEKERHLWSVGIPEANVPPPCGGPIVF